MKRFANELRMDTGWSYIHIRGVFRTSSNFDGPFWENYERLFFVKSSIINVWQDPKYSNDSGVSKFIGDVNPLSDELFECVWPFCVVGT